MLGTGELLVILSVVLVLFGGKKLPELARSIGLGVREFKKACHGIEDDEIFEKKPLNKSNSKKEMEAVTIEVESKSTDFDRPI